MQFDAKNSQSAKNQLKIFQNILKDILEADNKLYDDIWDDSFFLSSLKILDDALTKTTKQECFAQIPTEQILQLQQVLLRYLKAVSEANLILPSTFANDDMDSSLTAVVPEKNSLEASNILLKTMTSGRIEKELFSEELIIEVLDNACDVLVTGILPLAKAQFFLANKELESKQDLFQYKCSLTLQCFVSFLKLLGDLVEIHGLPEAVISSMESIASKFIFFESSPSRETSILKSPEIEKLRKLAANLMVTIVRKYPDQRSSILDDVLSSLHKLPFDRQLARKLQFSEGNRPIQLVSALFMQIIQSSAMVEWTSQKTETHENEHVKELGNNNFNSKQYHKSRKRRRNGKTPINSNNTKEEKIISTLEKLSLNAVKTSQSIASRISTVLLRGAIYSTDSTGHSPERTLLNIFVEDFITVVKFPEWPAAELLLRNFSSNFLDILNDHKSSVLAKNIAIDGLSLIGGKIADLRKSLFKGLENVKIKDSFATNNITTKCFKDTTLERANSIKVITNKSGPYQIVVDYLRRSTVDNQQQNNARCFSIVQWANSLCKDIRSHSDDDNEEFESNTTRDTCWMETANWLISTINNINTQTSENHDSSNGLSSSEIWTFNTLILLSLPLGRSYKHIFHALMITLTSQQVTVRSRSVKSISLFLDKDPSLLRQSPVILQHMLQKAFDPSPSVRDPALSFVVKSIDIIPDMITKALKILVANSVHQSIAVRKKTIKLLLEIYLNKEQQNTRLILSSAILRCFEDSESSIVELSYKTMQTIWLQPFEKFVLEAKVVSVEDQRLLQEHINLMIATITSNTDITSSVEGFLRKALSKQDNKHEKSNRAVCSLFISMIFDIIIDRTEEDDISWKNKSLQTLTVFARAEPKLFNTEQMLQIKPYVDDVLFGNSDALSSFGSILSIYCRVLPILPHLNTDFLLGVQEVLLKTLSKLDRHELEEAASCLAVLDRILGNTKRLACLVGSILCKIESLCSNSLDEDKEMIRLRKYLMLAGVFGKTCNLDSQIEFFRQAFPSRKLESIPLLIIDTIIPLTSVERSDSIRETAFCSIGLICQSWPENYSIPRINTIFCDALQNKTPRILGIVLSGLLSLYGSEDNRSKHEKQNPTTRTDLGISMKPTYHEEALSSITRQFLPQIIAIALSSHGSLASIAAKLIISINGQGLVHPKECISTLVALESSPEAVVAKTAFNEHKDMHIKHESVLETEYIKAVEQTFNYQHNNWNCALGANTDFTPKLRSFYEVLKEGSLILRKKILTSLCMKLVINVGGQITRENLVKHLEFSRFVLVNISLFAYGHIDEILRVTSTIEKVLKNWSGSVSQKIECLLNTSSTGTAYHEQFSLDVIHPDSMVTIRSNDDDNSNKTTKSKSTNVSELESITIESMILSMMWQTRSFLCQSWALQSSNSVRSSLSSKGKSDKAPTRIAKPSFETHLFTITQIMAALQNEETMKTQCKAFLGLLIAGDEVLENQLDNPSATSFEQEKPAEDQCDTSNEVNSGNSRLHDRSIKVRSSERTPSRNKRNPSFSKTRRKTRRLR